MKMCGVPVYILKRIRYYGVRVCAHKVFCLPFWLSGLLFACREDNVGLVLKKICKFYFLLYELEPPGHPFYYVYSQLGLHKPI